MPATNHGGNWPPKLKARLPPRLICQSRTGNLICPPVLKADGAELSTPEAARVKRDKVRLRHEAERRPVPAHDRSVCALAPRHGKPRKVAWGNIAERALVAEFHAPVRCANAQAGHRINNDPIAVVAGERIVPVVGMVAIEFGQ